MSLLPVTGHVLQVCPRTHSPRVERHNKIEQLVVRNAKLKGWSCMVEPAIPTTAGIRRPDIITYHEGEPACAIDVQIVADNAVLSEAHKRKCHYFDQPEIIAWIREFTKCSSVTFSSITLSWRGVFAHESATCFHQLLAVSKSCLSLISQATMVMGMRIHRQFKASTYRMAH